VSAVLKLCEWLQHAKMAGECGASVDQKAVECEVAAVRAEAGSVEQRWHSVWIQSVEWQVRLEDAIAGRNVRTL